LWSSNLEKNMIGQTISHDKILAKLGESGARAGGATRPQIAARKRQCA
jgi:hypothetical protein